MIPLFWLLLILALPIAFVLRITYRLRRLRSSVVTSWSQLEKRLKARYDLICEFMPLVRRASRHSAPPLERILQRIETACGQASQYMQLLHGAGGPAVTGMAPLLEAEGRLTSHLMELFSALDAQKELSGDNLRPAREQISAAETQIAFVRLNYNDAAMYYNLAQNTRMGRWLAEAGQHSPVELYRLDSPTP